MHFALKNAEPGVAACHDHAQLLQILQTHSNDLNENGFNGSSPESDSSALLHCAVSSQSLRCVKSVLKVPEICQSKRNEHGDTALMQAIKCNKDRSSSIVKELIESDLSLFDYPDSDGNYPIHEAIQLNQLSCVKVLIEAFITAGKEPADHLNKAELNAIMMAIEQQNFQIFDYLSNNTKFYGDFAVIFNCYTSPSNISNHNEIDCDKLESLHTRFCGDKILDLTAIDIGISNVLGYENSEGSFRWLANRYVLVESNPNLDLARIYWDALQDKSPHVQKQHYYNFLFLMQPNSSNCKYRHPYNYTDDIVRCINGKWIHGDKKLIDFVLSKYATFLRYLDDFDLSNWLIYFLSAFYQSCELFDKDRLMAFLFELKIHKRKITIYRRAPMETFEWRNIDEVTFNLIIMMPFLKMACADQLNDSQKYRKFIISSNSKIFFGQKYRNEPLSLAEACRFTIRKMAFEDDSKENTIGNLLTISRDLPSKLQNFLLFNETNFNLAAHMNGDLLDQ